MKMSDKIRDPLKWQQKHTRQLVYVHNIKKSEPYLKSGLKQQKCFSPLMSLLPKKLGGGEKGGGRGLSSCGSDALDLYIHVDIRISYSR